MDAHRLTRRRFVTHAGAVAAGAVVLGPRAALAQDGASGAPTLGGRFAEGVMSGDPSPTGITLWSRVAEAGGRGTVELEVARDKGFDRVVARKLLATNDTRGHAVKARIRGLDPYEQYYYRFATRDQDGPVGRFRTALPAGSRQPVRFAFFSCQEFTFGYYNAHTLLAREDVDFVVNLGDYIYADLAFTPPLGVRPLTSTLEPYSLESFRERYSRYRGDSALRKVHARFPLISLWDDHEVQNDYAGGDPEGGNAGDDYTPARRNAGYRAFFESMPTYAIGRQRLYHRASFGSLVDLFVLDERQYRAAQPNCGTEPDCPALDDARDHLGEDQLRFARGGIKRSDAAWKVVANGLAIMPTRKDADDPGNVDAWAGYAVEREALLRTVRDAGDVVFITGDYHAFIAGDVKLRNGQTVAAEFVGGSVTSASDPELFAVAGTPGYGTPDEPAHPESDLAARRAANGDIYADLDYIRHGYVLCQASASRFKATFKKLETIRRRSTELSETRSFTVRRGEPGLAG